MMVFVEAFLFTKYVKNYLTDDEYRRFQAHLLKDPTAGDLIQGTGGLRKIRWAAGNKGKRGGVRIIYYWQKSEDQIYLLTLYAKNEVEDLSAKDKKTLKQMIEEW